MTLVKRLLLLAGCIACLRIVILAVTPTDLFFDEAQYWAWSQNLGWGYFSKPPLIAWIIRLTTEIGGSDLPFWVRFAAPVLHSLTAVVIGLWVAEANPRAAIWAAAVYLSMPILAVGSWMISTDTVMAPFLAGGLWAWWRHLETRAIGPALVAGALVGLAVLAKYAGAYFWLVVLVAALVPGLRPRPIAVMAALAAFLLTIAPNMVWNFQNGLITFAHTAENASWDEGVRFNWASLAEFAGAQVFVIGPVFFLVLLLTLRRGTGRFEKFLICGSLPILVLVSGQAFISQAYANWAFSAFISAAPLVAVWLVGSGRWRWLAVGLSANMAIVLLATTLIVAPHFGPRIMDRYMGRAEFANEIVEKAGGISLAASERQLLADLTYIANQSSARVDVFAFERHDPPKSWYEMHSLRPLLTSVWLVTEGQPPGCGSDDLPRQSIDTPNRGAYARRTFFMYLVPPECSFGMKNGS